MADPDRLASVRLLIEEHQTDQYVALALEELGAAYVDDVEDLAWLIGRARALAEEDRTE